MYTKLEDISISSLSRYVPLYYIGNIDLLNTVCFTIVGSRKVTSYGKQVTKDLCGRFSKLNITTVSGYVDGVDINVLKNTISAGGNTIICLGYGFDYFSKSNLEKVTGLSGDNLFSRVLVLSQFPPDQNATKWTFPKRDELLSSVSRGVVVVEAGEKSGTFYTVKQAFKENKKVFAVPGNIYSHQSRGCHQIITAGFSGNRAELFYDFSQVQKYLKIKCNPSADIKKTNVGLSGDELAVYKQLSAIPIHFDDLLSKTGISSTSQNIVLTKLELKGLIKKGENSLYNIVP